MKARRLVPPRLRPVARRLYRQYGRLRMATSQSVHGIRRRAEILDRYGAFAKAPVASLRYLIFGRELDNFTYEIANLDELATFVAYAVGSTKKRAGEAIDELERDKEFRDGLEK